MTDLLPCPFCGEAVSFYRDSQTGGQQVGMTKAGILCQRCGTTHFYGSDASHIRTCARWNTRPIEDRLRRELDDVEKMRCPICDYPAPENEKDWPNSECVVCTQSDELCRLQRELDEAREAIQTAVKRVLEVRTGEPRQELWDLLKYFERWSSNEPAVRRAMEYVAEDLK